MVKQKLVSFLAVMLLLIPALLILIVPLPSFADRIILVRQYTMLAVGCDLGNNIEDFASTTKVVTYHKPIKLTFNCERPGGDIDLKKGESIALRCLHDNPLTIPKYANMKTGDLSYVLCNGK